ncbi:MAG: hypothetical protein PHO57_06840 [Acidithiobacillus sp.]|nr:hypothetical protein [Acidithiobacillus sp.]
MPPEQNNPPLGSATQQQAAGVQQSQSPGISMPFVAGVLQQQMIVGPIPPAQQFIQYPPEAQAVILRMAEEEQKRRNDRLDQAELADHEDQRAYRSLQKRGQT